MEISDPKSWWVVFNEHYENIKKIVQEFNPGELERFEIAKKKEDHEELLHILNAAWYLAPDTPRLHSIPSWLMLCDLCSEEWVFQPNEHSFDEIEAPVEDQV